ncbi:peptide/nickel transport system ATP-binding protein [Caldanaerobius fijiensis DSM 17918]|uniref:Peptide/nickel transport system ATP-binding protein n=1 Tax=Caldanaerobius fijiensis DSM 17918 TaxID=1121256 RepID=A0A1M4XWF9_9THEO|nr:ABC transporter ATP-binding protein [Caldanaerobius fijiensis]SHE97765.1 peptide/nickel transport system ATP-binding protein [Caldanaerobius fijiensis DSM 17918]
MDEILQIRNLSVEFYTRRGVLRAVDSVSLDVYKNQITAVVGESGSGKSTLASAILNVVQTPGIIVEGSEILFEGVDLLKLSEEEMRKYRWNEIAMVFQAAQNSLNPVVKIKDQILETYKAHRSATDQEIYERASKLLDYVRLDPERVLKSYPHELSGGMKQRVIIALSLLLNPKLLILDEPTTALDVITQAYIFDILVQLHKDTGITMLMFTHDVAIVAKIADRLAVMYAGKIVEVGDIREIFYNAKHPYTRGLLNAAPSLLDDVSKRKAIKGLPPDMISPPKGCRFHPRCSLANEYCREYEPCMKDLGNKHLVACHLYDKEALKDGSADVN